MSESDELDIRGIASNLTTVVGHPVPVHHFDPAKVSRRSQANPPEVGKWAVDLITGHQGTVNSIDEDGRLYLDCHDGVSWTHVDSCERCEPGEGRRIATTVEHVDGRY